MTVEEVAASRGMPFSRVGMAVECDGHPGVIIGGNESSNFQILFTDGPNAGNEGNCHPLWRMKYFAADGSLIYDSEKEQS